MERLQELILFVILDLARKKVDDISNMFFGVSILDTGTDPRRGLHGVCSSCLQGDLERDAPDWFR